MLSQPDQTIGEPIYHITRRGLKIYQRTKMVIAEEWDPVLAVYKVDCFYL